MKTRLRQNVWILAGAFALLAIALYFYRPSSPVTQSSVPRILPQLQGFAHSRSIGATGTDGKIYRVDIYWDDIHSIPGQHAIMTRTWNSGTAYIEQHFKSGNRTGLRKVSVRAAGNHDSILFHLDTYYGPSRVFENTVDAKGLHGYPEMIEAWEKKIRQESAKIAEPKL